MANLGDNYDEVFFIDDNGGMYNANDMMSGYSLPLEGPRHGTDTMESRTLFDAYSNFSGMGGNNSMNQYNYAVPGNGTITTFNNNQSMTSKAESVANNTIFRLPGGSRIWNLVKSGVAMSIAGGAALAGGAGGAGAAITGLASVASNAINGWLNSRTVQSIVTHLTDLGNVGETVGQSIGGISQDIRAATHGISGVVTNATGLASQILQLLSRSMPDSLTAPTITKYALLFMLMRYAPGVIRTLTSNMNTIMFEITNKIASMINGPNQARTNRQQIIVRHHNGKVPAQYNNFVATKRSNYISSRKNFRNQLSKQLSREEINKKMSTYLMEWLDTELNTEPQPTLIDILQQVPQQTAIILKKINPNITTESQEEMKQYMLNRTPCDIIDWFYYSMSPQLDNVPENVRRWIYQLPQCDLTDPDQWMRVPLSMLPERPDLESYKVPENNIPWENIQEQLNQMLLSEQQQQML